MGSDVITFFQFLIIYLLFSQFLMSHFFLRCKSKKQAKKNEFPERFCGQRRDFKRRRKQRPTQLMVHRPHRVRPPSRPCLLGYAKVNFFFFFISLSLLIDFLGTRPSKKRLSTLMDPCSLGGMLLL